MFMKNKAIIFAILAIIIIVVIIYWIRKRKENFAMETTNGIMSEETRFIPGQGL